MKRLLAVALVLFPTLARAEFTGPEKLEVAEQYRACEAARAAVKEIGNAATTDYGPEARAKLSTAGRWASTAADTCVKSQGWLFHLHVGATDAQNNACGVGTFTVPLFDRPAAVACAKERRDRADVELAQVQTNIAAYRPLASEEAGKMLDLASSYVTKGRAFLAGIDFTLPYSDPFPSIYPRQFAVHGQYDRAQWTLVISHSYFNSLTLQAWEEYAAGAGPSGLRLGQTVRALMYVTRLVSYSQDAIQHALLLGARSGLTDAEIAWSDVDRAFRANERLSDPVGGAADSMHFAYSYAVTFFAHPVRASFTDGWRFLDAWFYWFFNGGIGRDRGF